MTAIDNNPAPSVTAALETRRSVRAFSDRPVSDDLLRELLTRAARAPSGGNLQPWFVYVLNGAVTDAFRERIRRVMQRKAFGEPPEYPVYPEKLSEPYRTRRRDVGEQLYGILGIEKTDKAGRLQQLARNYDFFNAPAAVFFAIDRQMNANQWAHLGMYMQSLMLLLREAGLHSCPQEAWAMWHSEIADFCAVPQEQMVYCGLAIGYADPEAPINAMVTPRAPLESFARFVCQGA